MMNGPQDTYRHSGHVGNGLILIPPLGLVSAAVLSTIYAYAAVYNPLVYVSVLLTVGLAAGLGFSLSWSAVVSKCRNLGLIRLLCVLIGLLTLYLSWAVFVFALFRRYDSLPEDVSLLQIMTHPDAIWNAVLIINEEGWYSFTSITPTGIMLWVTWGIEAGILVIGPMIFAVKNLEDMIFCERCDRWCREIAELMRLAIPDDEAILHRIQSGDIAALATCPVVPQNISPYMQVRACQCESCLETATISINIVAHVPKKDGSTEEKKHALCENRLLTGRHLESLKELSRREPVDVVEAAQAEQPEVPDEAPAPLAPEDQDDS